MTDTNSPSPTSPTPDDDNAGVQRPDKGGTNTPGQTKTPPAPGGEGSAGAGGPDGFGTGT